MIVVRLSAGLLAIAAASCGPSATEGGFDSANPAAKLYAIEQAACAGDRSAVPQIIEQLDSDDPAVRLLAISALERLTGRTFGYHHDDPPEQRREAIDAWVQALQAGELNGRQGQAASESAPAPPAALSGMNHG